MKINTLYKIFLTITLFNQVIAVCDSTCKCGCVEQVKKIERSIDLKRKKMIRNSNPLYTQKGYELNQALRKLWSDHVIWTRQYITSAIANLADTKTAAGRLLKNQEDLGNAMIPYYGVDAGKKLTELLKEHILIAVKIIDAGKAGNQAKLKEEDKNWHENAKDIAKFLSGANPNWKEAEMISMLNDHLALTTKEVVARLGKKWNDDVAAYDKIYVQALGMADGFTQGIVKQFPEKF
ncbi:glycosyltransferase [Candidatus Dependentiae bacterium]|nr:glycosyltransferase [Candidatus Dependentiae bacterium]